jgi:hypothetical protein
MAGPYEVHTAANAVPPLDDEFEAALDAIRGIHPGLDQIADGYRLLALDRHSLDTTQTITVALAGSPDNEDALALIGYTIARLTNPDTNPALRALDFEAQKRTQQPGERLVFDLTDHRVHQHASNASGAIHTD